MESYTKGISPPLSAFLCFRFLHVQSALRSPDNKLCIARCFYDSFRCELSGAKRSSYSPEKTLRISARQFVTGIFFRYDMIIRMWVEGSGDRNLFYFLSCFVDRNRMIVCNLNISGASSTLAISGRKPVNGCDNKRLKVDINGMYRKVVAKAWQDTEEEEFDWREIIPSSQYHSQRNGLVSSSSTPLVADSVPNNLVPAAAAVPAVVSSPSLTPPYTRGTITANNYAMIDALPNPIPQVHPSMSMNNAPSSISSMNLPPLPPGPRPAFSQSMPMPHNPVPISFNAQVGGALSAFTSSRNGERLISFTNRAPVQDPVPQLPLDFNPNFLKMHHESVLNALYADLSRQCGRCGFRYKSQEEHYKHIDWHERKTQICNSRKGSSKEKPSRRWYVSAGVWLGGAGALGTESVVNTKDDQEFAVPADDNQTTCALCGERFDDFFSEETDDWMYKGAVYMNGPGVDGSLLGPLVHAKCR
ncbi:uncharacterized protein LOC127794741 [Diospyros lotus]|uniref:uncharacterized protein LOC127794741 n=1 Tax=Diospyros lotus TaxID=55363 RepID=UPI0022565457|nr:uncharacterized protein LOC127794741 [Diospyros lotus]